LTAARVETPGKAHLVEQTGLSPLLSDALAPLFDRPVRLNVDSAWYGHIPFAHWIVTVTQPRLLVELGAHAGVSYSAFCEAVLRAGLDTKCFAVDTWRGDEHAGFYDESIFNDLNAFHALRYGGFSQLLRCTFDEALPFIPDQSIDLLHIDGRHHYDDVRHDFESWRPKLSSRAVVLFHDTNVRERDFGVWRLWAELRQSAPGFEFLHGYGLGVLAFGEAAPAPVAALCAIENAGVLGQLRERFAVLGERWAREFDCFTQQREVTSAIATATDSSATAVRLQQVVEDMHKQLVEMMPRADKMSGLRVELSAARLDRLAAERLAAAESKARDEARRETELVRQERDLARQETEAARQESAELMRRLLNAIGWAQDEQSRAREAHSLAQAERARAREEQLRAHAERARAERAEQRANWLEADRHGMGRSLSWRVTRPLRVVRRSVAGLRGGDLVHQLLVDPPALPVELRPQPAVKLPPLVEPLPPPIEPIAPPVEVLPPPVDIPAESAPAEAETENLPRRLRVLFASGGPFTTGHVYRCERFAALANELGWDAHFLPVAHIGVPTLVGADLVVLWRVEFSEHVRGVIEFAHKFGARVAFDIDDLVFRPEHANEEMMDSLRIGTFSENGALAMFRRFRDTLERCDLALCTTDEIARYIRLSQKPVWIVPNGFDSTSERAARLARRAKHLAGENRLVRIGYAAGSRTHQKDFAEAAGAVAAVLRVRPHARLVLFYDPEGGEGVILTHEFSEFAELGSQIESRAMVSLAELPGELARFDINIAPLEAANPFCAAKSELKYFEAALVDVPTVASANSGAISRAIHDGQTGFLAADVAQWEAILLRLVDDAALRQRIGHNAYHDVLWQFGPRRVGEFLDDFLRSVQGGQAAAVVQERAIRRGSYHAPGLPLIVAAETLFEADQLRQAEVTVAISSFNYSTFIIEALESVRQQTLPVLDLVVVDDASPDDSADAVLAWVRQHANRFNRVTVLRHHENGGLGAARNSGFSAAETPFVLPLDADNRLHPECCAVLLEVMQRSRAAYVYPQLQHFGTSEVISGGDLYEPRRLVGGNFIDAMALVAKWAWAAAGGYYQDRTALGWEDFDLWCSLAELGQWGEPVARPLAEYRVHAESMVNMVMETTENKPRLVQTLEQRHAWLHLTSRTAYRR
jgi:glycosyltransferase involved in cell wall biosynthesis